jgi:uncharacterized protein with ParB-like and HNH nuclease domain
MQGNVIPLSQLMQGGGALFIIPVYQRNYDWKKANCKKLYDDLIDVSKTNKNKHFFGSIVYKPSGMMSEVVVIDGQQRLTTVSLLLLAMMNLLFEGKVTSNEESTAEMIKDLYLTNPFKKGDENLKLKPIKKDNIAFHKLFGDPDDFIMSSNMTVNYLYFYNRIQEKNISIDELFKAIQKLEIMQVSLDAQDDDPQLIFESLNSTGLDLSEGDKIRNFILMGESPAHQEEYYDKYWNVIEEKTAYDVSDFIRHYLTLKQNKIPNFSNIYFDFKEYVTANAISIESLLIDLLAYAKRYEQIKKASTTIKGVNEVLKRIYVLEMSVTTPFFLEILKNYEAEVFSADEIINVFQVIETFLVRRSICDIPTSSLNKIFSTLNRDVLKLKTSQDDYAEVMKYFLLTKTGTSRMPKDEEFREAIKTKDFYHINNKWRAYIFNRLENGNSKETTEIVDGLLNAKKYSIEHIMPQTLSKEWQKELGEDFEQVHEIWLNRLANLTVTGYNSNYSNRVFSAKRDMPDGFKNSPFRLNDHLKKAKQWTEQELEERSKDMEKNALGLWKYPSTSFEPIAIDVGFAPFDSEQDYTGMTIAAFDFLGSGRIPVKYWKEMIINIIKMLFDKDPSILYQLAAAEEPGLAISFIEDERDGYVKIAERLYFYGETSTWAKENSLKKLFELYKIAEDDLMIEFKDDGKNKIHKAVVETIKSVLDSNPEVIRDSKMNFRYIRFTTQTLDDLIEKSGMGWTSSGRILLYECDIKSGKIGFTLYVGPGEESVRQKILNIVEKNQSQGIFSEIGSGKKWTQIYRKDILPKNYIDQYDDVEDIKNDIKAKLDTFFNTDMIQINEAIAREYQIS